MTFLFSNRNFAFVLLLALVVLSGCARRPLLTGEWKGDLVWSGTVYLRGDVILAEHSRLTIQPGTTIIFLPPDTGEDRLTEHPHFPGSELIVRGELLAEGTAERPIVFRYAKDSAPAGSWGGINLQGSPGARFRFCRFTQADSALHSQESIVAVEESIFDRNLVAIRFHSSQFLIQHNLIHDNGTGIRFHFGAPAISRNRLVDNEKAFFITAHPQDYQIVENEILSSQRYSVVLGEEVPEDVIFQRNYWGGLDSERIAATLFDGRRDAYLGRVRFTPLCKGPIDGAGVSWSP